MYTRYISRVICAARTKLHAHTQKRRISLFPLLAIHTLYFAVHTILLLSFFVWRLFPFRYGFDAGEWKLVFVHIPMYFVYIQAERVCAQWLLAYARTMYKYIQCSVPFTCTKHAFSIFPFNSFVFSPLLFFHVYIFHPSVIVRARSIHKRIFGKIKYTQHSNNNTQLIIAPTHSNEIV